MIGSEFIVVGRELYVRLACRCFALVIFASPVAATPLQADKILIEKKSHQLTLLANGTKIKSYRVALGKGGLAPKTVEGDQLTPEGTYIIDSRNRNSDFYRALHISYPTPRQRADATRRGINPGGAIMIHGLRNGMSFLGLVHTWSDWTNGCIAVKNSEMDEIWSAVRNGTPVEIRR